MVVFLLVIGHVPLYLYRKVIWDEFGFNCQIGIAFPFVLSTLKMAEEDFSA